MRRRAHNTAVFIFLYMLTAFLFSIANLIICCGVTLETSNSLQAKDKTAINPPTSHTHTHTNHPLDLKSKQPKWLDEIRATLLTVKLNRICAC